jgi:hypothetical protein
MHCTRSHDAVIRVYEAAGNVIETLEHEGDFTGLQQALRSCSFFADTFATRGRDRLQVAVQFSLGDIVHKL